MLGVLAGIEVARAFAQHVIALRHDLEIVDFLAEEPTDFGISTVGSRALAGALDARHAQAALRRSVAAEAIASVGGRPRACLVSARVGSVQDSRAHRAGPRWSRRRAAGRGPALTGIRRVSGRQRSQGRPDHAVTMPMALRRDALAGAAEVVLALERLWQHRLGRRHRRPPARRAECNERRAWHGRVCWPRCASVDAARARAVAAVLRSQDLGARSATHAPARFQSLRGCRSRSPSRSPPTRRPSCSRMSLTLRPARQTPTQLRRPRRLRWPKSPRSACSSSPATPAAATAPRRRPTSPTPPSAPKPSPRPLAPLRHRHPRRRRQLPGPSTRYGAQPRRSRLRPSCVSLHGPSWIVAARRASSRAANPEGLNEQSNPRSAPSCVAADGERLGSDLADPSWIIGAVSISRGNGSAILWV